MIITSSHVTSNAGGNFTVSPGSQIHHEEVIISGASGTRMCIISAIGLVAGALVTIRYELPSTANITIQMYDQTLLGNLLSTINTDATGLTPAAKFQFWYDGNNFNRDFQEIPANGQQT